MNTKSTLLHFQITEVSNSKEYNIKIHLSNVIDENERNVNEQFSVEFNNSQESPITTFFFFILEKIGLLFIHFMLNIINKWASFIYTTKYSSKYVSTSKMFYSVTEMKSSH